MQLAQLSKKMITAIAALAPIMMAASAVYYRSMLCLPFIAGVFLGAAVSVVKVLLLRRTVDRASRMDKKKAAGYTSLQHLLRLFLTGASVAPALIWPDIIHLWGTVAGVFTYQVAVYLIKFTNKT